MSEIDIEKCCITHYPAEVLAERAKPVEKINDNIRQLVEKMIVLMLEHKGVGLAAPQAGVPLRLFIISLDTSRESVKVFINPTVTPITDETGSCLESMEEGCLSVPDVTTKIRRHKKCKVTATDLDGNEFTEEAEGLYAKALQHEFDHIEGMTIINRMGSTARIVHRKQLKKLEKEHDNISTKKQK
ncbi:MAG: peptide deformylase [Planctomycetota bacterium]|jgi:peptide deformylase